MKTHLVALIASLPFLFAGAANAATAGDAYLSVFEPSSTQFTTEANDHFGEGRSFVHGGLRLVMDAGTSATINYTMYSKEAAVIDEFSAGSGSVDRLDNGMAAGTTITRNIKPGLLDFGFRSRDLAADTNHGAFDNAVGIVLGADKRSGWLLFDDNFYGMDRDYDDMVVRFKVTTQPVPEPQNLALMLAGLGALGVGLRRRQRSR